MKNYVVGFLISATEVPGVVLIRKNRPDWQVGLWNGVGGHIEEHEGPLEAMTREFKEETGVTYNDWDNFLTVTYKDCTVWFFKSFTSQDTLIKCRTVTDEPIKMFSVENLPLNLVPNLRWIIPLALDPYVRVIRAEQ